MFYARQNNQDCEPVGFVTRAKKIGAGSAQGVGSAATVAASGIGKGVQQGVYGVRVWAAPRLESAADWHTTTFAPMVSSALRGSAQQIRPVDVTVKKSRSMLTWSVLAAAVLATAGALAAFVKYQQRAMTTTDEGFEDSAAGAAPAETGDTAPVQGVPSAPGTPVTS